MTQMDDMLAEIGSRIGDVQAFSFLLARGPSGLPAFLDKDAYGLRVSDATAQASLSSIFAGMATATLQSALSALVATPTTPNAITASDSTDTTAITAKGIVVGGAGNLVVRGVGSTTDVTFTAVAGQYIPLQASRVMAATTATGLVGLS